MELQTEIKKLRIKGDQASLARAEELENNLKLLEADFEFQKKYGTTGKSYDPGAAAKTSNLIKNLDDEEYIVNNIPFGPGFGQLTLDYYGAPRTVGMDIHYKF